MKDLFTNIIQYQYWDVTIFLYWRTDILLHRKNIWYDLFKHYYNIFVLSGYIPEHLADVADEYGAVATNVHNDVWNVIM